MNLTRRILLAIASRLPVREIRDDEDDSLYLSKYALWHGSKRGISVHLHRFHRSDADRQLHSHPFRWSFGLILSGGYVEERHANLAWSPSHVLRREFWPGMVNVIFANTFHRVELMDDECWTLFVNGPVDGSWGFLDVATHEFVPHREFKAWKAARKASGA